MEETGRCAEEAAIEATSEIALAVLATTLSLVVILPRRVHERARSGRFFYSFGFVVGPRPS